MMAFTSKILSMKSAMGMVRNFSNKFVNVLNLNGPSNKSKVHIIPALQDNYMYVLIDNCNNHAVAIDPVEPDKIFQIIEEESASLVGILTTHHHYDHAGGNNIIKGEIKDLPVYGGDDRIEGLTHKVSHKEKFKVSSFVIECLSTPCHTKGHVCYHLDSKFESPICFTGDTLFVSGCGRFFEGTANNMLDALDILANLNENTKIYCGHEYTLNNLQFAVHVEPSNALAKVKLEMCKELRQKNIPTVPSTITHEIQCNPFMRVRQKAIQKFVGLTNPVEVMAKLRELKDNFVPV